MSRSFKKHKIYKDYNGGSKKLNHRIFRRVTKHRLNGNRELPTKMSEVMNSYDISDYKFFCDNPEDCRCIAKYGRRKCTKK